MAKPKLASMDDDKPVKLAVTLPASLHRNLVAYAEILAKETGKPVEANQLIAPMLERFIASDRGFAKLRDAAKKASCVVAFEIFDQLFFVIRLSRNREAAESPSS